MADRPLPAAPPAGPGAGGSAPPRPRWLQPRVVFPALAALLVAAIVLAPENAVRSGDQRLTTHSASSGGAKALYETARRLGWRTERSEVPLRGTLDPRAVYAVLDPPVDLTAGEAHALLETVRRGAGLLVVVGRRSTLADSLGVRAAGSGKQIVPPEAIRGCSQARSIGTMGWADDSVMLYGLRATRPVPPDTVTFLRVRSLFPARALRVDTIHRDSASRAGSRADSSLLTKLDPSFEQADAEPDTAGFRMAEERARTGRPAPRYDTYTAAFGMPVGRGRVAVVSDPDLLRNDVLRECKWNAGVTAVRMLEWADPLGGRRLVFDEFHQGFGRHASVTRAMRHVLLETPGGRVLAHLAAAALVLLAAAGVRAIPPRPRGRIERRSALEHVGALAKAYEQAGATRTAARRLLRGIRRRHAHGMFAGSDADFARALASRHPAVAGDVERLLAAADHALTPAELLEVGRAAARIDNLTRGSGLGTRHSALGARPESADGA